MALISCEDCGADVSDRAPACIKCGAPMGDAEVGLVLRDENGFPVDTGVVAKQAGPAKSSGGVFEFVGFALIVVGMVGCVWSGGGGGVAQSALLLGGFVVFLVGRFIR